MASLDVVADVLRHYPLVQPAPRWTALGSEGGFSGAKLWRVVSSEGDFCLRRWPPEHPDEDRLHFIHSVLRTAFEGGLHEVPLPIIHSGGDSFFRHDGFLWELAPWMPGAADYHCHPTREKLRSALQWLAKFHAATAPSRSNFATSPGIEERRKLLQQLLSGDCAEIVRRLDTFTWPEFVVRGRRMLAAFQRDAHGLATTLTDASRLACSLQPCIRDIWHDHVLFEGDQVTGVVDFGALRPECVATDIARLLGSLVRDDPEGQRIGLDAYSEIRPLGAEEQKLWNVFDASTVLLSGMNWLRWICLEQRSFEHPDRVLARLDEILLRLDRPRRQLIE